MRLMLAIVLALLMAEAGWAQDSQASDRLQQVLTSLEPSARLRIEFTDSLEVQGKYLGAESGIVRLRVGDRDSSFTVASVSRISERGRFTWTGGLIGAVAGAAVAGGITAAIAAFYSDEQLEPALRAAAMGAIIGVPIAFVIQDSRWHQRYP